MGGDNDEGKGDDVLKSRFNKYLPVLTGETSGTVKLESDRTEGAGNPERMKALKRNPPDSED